MVASEPNGVEKQQTKDAASSTKSSWAVVWLGRLINFAMLAVLGYGVFEWSQGRLHPESWIGQTREWLITRSEDNQEQDRAKTNRNNDQENKGLASQEDALEFPTDEKEVGARAKGPLKVEVKPVERLALRRTVDMVGSLRGFEEINLASKRSGRVVKVHHDMGDAVPPGELLVELETRDAELALLQAERRLAADLTELGLAEVPGANFDVGMVPSVVRARLALERAERNLNRARELSRKRAINPEEYENTLNDFQTAEAALAEATLRAQTTLANARVSQAAVEVARQMLADMTVTAPNQTAPSEPNLPAKLEYRIRKRLVEEGSYIREGETMFELVIVDPLRLIANVPERHASEIQVGQQAEVENAAYPGERFPATVARVNPAIDPVSRTFEVELRLPNPDQRLKPGGFAKARVIVGQTDNAVVVPADAIVKFAGNSKLFLYDPATRTAREFLVSRERPLEDDPTRVEIELKENKPIPPLAHVIVTGRAQLYDGKPVEPRNLPARSTAVPDPAATQSTMPSPDQATDPRPPT